MDGLIQEQLKKLLPQQIASYLEQLYHTGVIGVLPEGPYPYLIKERSDSGAKRLKELAAIMSNFPDRMTPPLRRIIDAAQEERNKIGEASPHPAETTDNLDYYTGLSFAQLKYMLGQRGIRGARNKEQAAQLLYNSDPPRKPIKGQQGIRQYLSRTTPVERRHESPMHEWYQRINTYGPTQVAEALGMVVPPGMDVRAYVLDNLEAYRDAIEEPASNPVSVFQLSRSPTPGNILDHYTDADLFSMLGVYVAYNSRQQLIHRLVNVVSGQGFFVPLNGQCQGAERLGSAATQGEVAYGSLLEYQCYSVRQLEDGIRRDNYGTYLELPDGTEITNLTPLRELAQVYGYSRLANALGDSGSFGAGSRIRESSLLEF